MRTSIYLSIYKYLNIYIYIYIYTDTHIHTNTHLAKLYIYIYTRIYIYIYIYTYIYICVCVCVCVCNTQNAWSVSYILWMTIYIYIFYILSSTDRLFRCITNFLCDLNRPPPQLYVRLSIIPLSQPATSVSLGIIRHYVVNFLCSHFALPDIVINFNLQREAWEKDDIKKKSSKIARWDMERQTSLITRRSRKDWKLDKKRISARSLKGED